LAQAGVRKLAAVIVARAPLAAHLSRRGYRGSDDLRYFERDLRTAAAPTNALAELGGQLIGPSEGYVIPSGARGGASERRPRP
jgi:hypothetical protein